MPRCILVSVAPAASLGWSAPLIGEDFLWVDPNGGPSAAPSIRQPLVILANIDPFAAPAI